MRLHRSRLLALVVLSACGAEPGSPESPGRLASDGNADCSETGGTAFDIVVVGSGPGGIAAAIQAARMHRSVMLIEPSGHVGGQLLTVTSMDEALQVGTPERREGIYADFADAVVTYYREHFEPDKPVGTCNFSDTSLCYEAAIGEQLLRQMLCTAGVQLHAGHDVVQVLQSAPRRVGGVVTDDGVAWTARVVIDATEYGDLLPFAGAAYRVGNRVREPGQPPSPDPGSDDACVQETTYTITIKQYPSLSSDLDLRGRVPPGDDYERHAGFYRRGVTEGPIITQVCGRWDWRCHAAYRGTPDRDNPEPYVSSNYHHTKTMINAFNDYPTQESLGDQGLPIAAVEDRAARHVHDCAARMMTTQFIYYGQQELNKPWAASDEVSAHGFNLDHCAQFDARALNTERMFPVRPYVREGRRMIGVRTVTGNDILRTATSTFQGFDKMAQRSWATSLTVGYYGNDLHGCWGDARLEADLGDKETMRTGGGPYQLPFGAFIPRDIDGLLVAEKNLSMSRLVNSAVRVQPAAMANGMAAGVIAALATAPGADGGPVDPRNVPPVRVQDALLASGKPVSLSLYTYGDVPFGSPRWGDVQLASTHGVLIGEGGFQFGAAHALTRGQAAIAVQRTFRYPLDPPSTIVYSDVLAGTTLWRYVQAMTREGLTAGCGVDANGHPRFCPNDPALRRELMVWIVAALHLARPACTTKPYADVETSDPICPFWAAAKGAGLAVTCTDANHVCPADPVTRADTTAFTRRAMVYMASVPTPVGACYRTPPDYCDP